METTSEITKEHKPSIFTCKNCKASEIKVERKPKNEAEKTAVAKLEPAKTTHMDQKYIVKIGGKTVAFGSKGMSDYTIHKSEDRKQAYIGRHQKRES